MNKILDLKFFIPLSIIAAGICGIIDFNSMEVQLPALCILIASSVFGFLNPKYSWLSGLLIGLGVITTSIIARTLGYLPAYNIEPNLFGGLLALIPAVSGTLIGVGLKKLFN